MPDEPEWQERYARSSSTPEAGPCSARPSVVKPLSNFVYRAMQVGVVLIAAGTFLGGVWAAYSWGRFWGWDPKEVWALIALLGYLVLLARPLRRLGQHRSGWPRWPLSASLGDRGLVRRELRPRRGAAQLRLYRRGLAGKHAHHRHGHAVPSVGGRLARHLGQQIVLISRSDFIHPRARVFRARSETHKPAKPGNSRDRDSVADEDDDDGHCRPDSSYCW